MPVPESRVLARIRLRPLPAEGEGGRCSGWMKTGESGVAGRRWVRACVSALPLGADLPLSQLMAHHHSFHHLRFFSLSRSNSARLLTLAQHKIENAARVCPQRAPLPQPSSSRPFLCGPCGSTREAVLTAFQPRFAGAVVRDDAAYWESYVTANVAEGLGAYWLQEGGSGAAPSAEGGRLVSFACLAHDKSGAGAWPHNLRRFRLTDFCADPTHVAADGGRFALEMLLSHALCREAAGGVSGAGEGGAGEGGGAEGAASEILLKMPGPVADSMGFRLADRQVPLPALLESITGFGV